VTYEGEAALLATPPPSVADRRESGKDPSSGKSEESDSSAGRQAQGDDSAAAGSQETEGDTTTKPDKPKKGKADRAAHDPADGSLLIDPGTLSLPKPLNDLLQG
jgi:hypothetical protein